MNENSLNQKDDMHFQQTTHSKKITNSSIISNKNNQKNTSILKNVHSQTNKKQNILSQKNIPSKIKKNGLLTPSQKCILNNIKSSKTFNKNNSKYSSKTVFPKNTNLTISLTFNEASCMPNMNNLNKTKPLNSYSKNQMPDNTKNLSRKTNNKNVKISSIIKVKTNKSREKRKNDKEKSVIHTDNDIFDFPTEECEENINENNSNQNSRKHYSLTNLSIPSIPFANPFNNNININSKKNEKHVRSLNINNSYDLKQKQILMEKNYLENLDIINVFQENEISEGNNKEEEEENVKLNISNLDIDIKQIDEDSDEKNQTNTQTNSFIQLNNNLSLKLAVEKTQYAPSYVLALYPKIFLKKKIKDLIKQNYAVKEPIFEEIDSDSKTPKQSKNKYSFLVENNNTKYTTKDKNSEKNNKKIQDFDSEENTSENEYKKFSIYDVKSLEKKNLKKNKKIIKDENIKTTDDDNKRLVVDNKKEQMKKKIHLNEILVETLNICHTNNNKEGKNLKMKKNNHISPKNISSHNFNNTINPIINNVTETNLKKSKHNKFIISKKESSLEEKHQKAKSLLKNINSNNLFLNETIQNNTKTMYNRNNKNKTNKIDYKQNDLRNKILSEEKNLLDNMDNKKIGIQTPKKGNLNKSKKDYTSRNNYYKDNDNKNIYNTCFQKININYNKNLHLIKNQKYKINPFLLNYSEDNLTYNNELNYTFNNQEIKNKNCNYLLKRRNDKSKKPNYNNDNIISTNVEKNKIILRDKKNITYNKEISQQFIDELNSMLDLKADNILSINNKNKLNQTHHYYFNKYNFKKKEKNKTSSKIFYKSNNESCNQNLKNQFIIPCHKKSKTFFISPSYALKKNNINTNKGKQFYKRINIYEENGKTNNLSDFNSTFQMKNSKVKNNKNDKLNNTTAIKTTIKRKIYGKFDIKKVKTKVIKGKNDFKEIKKVIRENTIVKAIHKKTNTMGNTNTLSFICQNLFNYNNSIQSNNQNLLNNNNKINLHKNNNYNSIYMSNHHKKALSKNNLMNNLDNKKKIICAMQRIKFHPISYYSKAIREMTQIIGNLLVILVYKDENQRFVFRGLYKVNENEPQYTNLIFGPNCESNILNVNNVNNFYNYSLNRGDFFRYKINDEKYRKFNDDIVIVF